jgi:hypothetical protein
MDFCLATLKAVSFYLLHNAESFPVAQVRKQFASYQGYPNYKWDLIQ